MVALSLIRASLVVVGLLTPATLAAPTSTVLTPFGERPVANVHAVPKGMAL